MDERTRRTQRAAHMDPDDLLAQQAAQAERERSLSDWRDERQRRTRWNRLIQIRHAAHKRNVLRSDMPDQLLQELDNQYEAVLIAVQEANERLIEEGMDPVIRLVGDGENGWILQLRDDGAREDVKYDHNDQCNEWADALIDDYRFRLAEAAEEERMLQRMEREEQFDFIDDW